MGKKKKVGRPTIEPMPNDSRLVHYTDDRGIDVYVKMPFNAAELWRLELGLDAEEFYKEKPKPGGITFQVFKQLFDINDPQALPPYKIKIDAGIFVYEGWESVEILVRIIKFGLKTKDVLTQPVVVSPWVWKLITGEDIYEGLTENMVKKACTECNMYFRTEELKAAHKCQEG